MVKSFPGKIFNYINYIPVVVECILLFSKSIFCICKGYGKWFLFIFAITNSYRRKPQLLKLHFLMFNLPARASNGGYPKVREDITITEKAPNRAFSWLKAPTSFFTFKNLLRHYAKLAIGLKIYGT